MGFDEGRIVLDSPNGAYYAGQTIHGQLEFDQDHVKTFRGIYVKIKGFCKVHWTSTETRRVHDRQEHHTINHDSHEEYINHKVYLAGGESGEHTLQPGHHTFSFQCPIPPNCPASFEGAHGHVRYQIKVVVDRAFKLDQEKVVDIKVLAPLDLNTHPYAKEPVEFEIENSYCCWCMGAGSTETLIKMPVAGFCPGQNMPIEVSCKNMSNVEVDTIRFEIKETITFHATHEPGTRHQTDVVAEIKKGPIPENTTRNWTVQMPVPEMEVLNLINCRFIDIEHKFKVSVESSGCHTDSDESHPIVIGNIPIAGFQDNVPNPLQNQLPNQPVVSQNVQGVASTYPPPPIVTQPMGGGYPGGAPLPQVSPYPVGPSYPAANPPYPGANPPYPGANSPYPGVNAPYPGANPPYPGANPPYPGANPAYPGPGGPLGGNAYQPPITNQPYPPRSPYPGGNRPYPNSPQPYSGLNSNVPTDGTPLLKTGTIGFGGPVNANNAVIPSLPAGANVPYPTSPANPYMGASAPEPPTPDNENKQPLNGVPKP
ncbi:arrestin domain-containing protein 17 [Manduca sexta]|uniref:Arrestin C-terminal-like domain-containing protein n=1 Tax=Manduca sexta TaxID=7130 RepID=A0A922CPR7_MANSE|nr:arrestin domain-containing protein 17 [Manduca sexta]KAG6453952.1 hypothetical protein O3G_MSEX008422 [Manduca sexta]